MKPKPFASTFRPGTPRLSRAKPWAVKISTPCGTRALAKAFSRTADLTKTMITDVQKVYEVAKMGLGASPSAGLRIGPMAAPPGTLRPSANWAGATGLRKPIEQYRGATRTTSCAASKRRSDRLNLQQAIRLQPCT